MAETEPPARFQAAATRMPAEVSISNTRQIDFTSAINSRDYRIQVALPRVPEPDQGYRVLYVLDGHGYFGSATEAVRGNGNAADVVVVGIGYPFSVDWANRMLDRHFHGPDRPTRALPAIGVAASLARFYDLTPPVTQAILDAQDLPTLPRRLSSDIGGLDDFLAVVETEIKPRVGELARINTGKQALFGHSLGGLAALRSLFRSPNAFQTYVIGSPAIWWGERTILKDEAEFTALVNSGQATPRVLVTMGGLESDPPKSAPAGVSLETLKALIKRSRMVENARELVARLQALNGRHPFEVADYLVFPGQTHGISAWSTLAAGICFAFVGA